jgi:hypothetical protein
MYISFYPDNIVLYIVPRHFATSKVQIPYYFKIPWGREKETPVLTAKRFYKAKELDLPLEDRHHETTKN